MCEYTGAKNDPLRHSPVDLPAHVVDDMTKSLLNESLADCGRVGLAPFCKDNPAPEVNRHMKCLSYFLNASLMLINMLNPYRRVINF